jgi:hypothetical protein
MKTLHSKNESRQTGIERNIRLLPVLILSFVVFTFPAGAVVFVDCDNTSGPWHGSQAYPFATISDAVSSAGTYGHIHVAQGTYTETVVLLEGQVLEGGYADDWSDRNWLTYPVTIAGFPDCAVITMASMSRVDGFTVKNGTQGIAIVDCNGFYLGNCRIQSIMGTEMQYADGGDAEGIFLQNSNSACWMAKIYNIELQSILAGNGSSGGDESYILDGYDGGTATGVHIENGLEIEIETIDMNIITGGYGGYAGEIFFTRTGHGGDGGNAYGIHVAGQSNTIDITDCFLDSISSGHGGSVPWGHLAAGDGGHGGDVWGILADPAINCHVSHTIINTCTGGQGGSGGDSGDCPGSGDPGAGGQGGSAIGLEYTGTGSGSVFNLLIYGMTGGNGGYGGDTLTFGLCGSGGDAGEAIGIRSDHTQPQIGNVTVAECSGGSGGNGGIGHGWDHEKNLKITPTPPPTVTPTATSYWCWGGDGGHGIGIQLTAANLQTVINNIAYMNDGGSPGGGGNPADGYGYGIYVPVGASDAEYIDSYGNTVDFRGCNPGTGSFSLDPLFVSDSGGYPYYLSQIDAGQDSDSPCLDAGSDQAESLFEPDRYTTRTDFVPDTGPVDLGFHYDTIGNEPNTPFPTATQDPETPTFTPTATQPTKTPTPTCSPWPPPPTEPPWTRTPTPTRPPPTMTPTQSPPTVTVTATATPDCPPMGATCDLNQAEYEAGDLFVLTLTGCNGSDESIEVDMYLILDVYGMYFFWPQWGNALDWQTWEIPACDCISQEVLWFYWPENTGHADNIMIYVAMTEADTFNLLGNIGICSFSF